ncbi:MAG: putative DNA binding domain-containing protein [Pseudomonadota bacterium]|nr:putative DNA binding domain-containing protein [Pseudomonadota bacterium]
MSIYTAPVSELQDLVEKPVEREWLELKSWVDLTNTAARASTARYLAAISNYGGGYLVFGFNKDGTRCPRRDNVKRLYNHDVLAGIIGKYLHPTFQCEVSFPEFAGVEHAVTWIPSHGMSPVISKASGPTCARAQSLDGLTLVVDFSMSSAIAVAAMNRRQPRTTLGRLPERRSS